MDHAQILAFVIEAHDRATQTLRLISRETAQMAEQMQAQLRALQGEAERLGAATKGYETQLRTLKGEQGQSAAAGERQATSMRDVKVETEQAGVAGATAGRRMAEGSNAAAAGSAALATQTRRTGDEQTRANRHAEEHANALSRVGQHAQDGGKRISEFGHSVSAISLPLGLVGALAIKSAADFDSAMELIHTQAGASQREVDQLKDRVLNLAPAAGLGPQELAKGLFHVESAGFRGAAAMQVLRAASEGAKVGQTGLEGVSHALVGVLNSQIDGVHGARDAMAQLNAIVGAGDMHMGDLVGAISTGLIPTAARLGLRLRDVGAALDSLTSQGIPAQEAATRLRMTFTLMANPTSKAAAALAELGLSHDKLASDFHKKNGLIVALDDLRRHLDETFPPGSGHRLSIDEKRHALEQFKQQLESAGVSGSKLKNQLDTFAHSLDTMGSTAISQSQLLSTAFGGARAGSTMLALIGNVDLLRQKYSQLGHSSGIATFNDAIKHANLTEEQRFKDLQAQAQATGIRLGHDLLPVVVGIGKEVATLIEDFDRLPPGVRHTIEVVGGLAAVIGPVALAVGGITRGVGALLRLGGGIGRLAGWKGPTAESGPLGRVLGGELGLTGIRGSGVGSLANPIMVRIEGGAGGGGALPTPGGRTSTGERVGRLGRLGGFLAGIGPGLIILDGTQALAQALGRGGLTGGERVQQFASSATLGVLPAPQTTHGMDTRYWSGLQGEAANVRDAVRGLSQVDAKGFAFASPHSVGQVKALNQEIASLTEMLKNSGDAPKAYRSRLESLLHQAENVRAGLLQLRRNFGDMRNHSVLDMEMLNKEVGQNWKAIAAEMKLDSGQAAKDTTTNVSLAIRNVKELMKEGVVSNREGAQAIKGYLGDLDTAMAADWKAIATTMKTNAEAGSAAASVAIGAFVSNVRRMMKSGEVSTQQGMKMISDAFLSEARAFGIDTSHTSVSQFIGVRGSGSGIGSGHGQAQGGFVGDPRERGPDNVRIAVPPGSQVYNHHQLAAMGLTPTVVGRGEYVAPPSEAPIFERHARRAGFGGIDDLFARVTTPHYRASGGRIQQMIAEANAIDAHHYQYSWGGGHDAAFAPGGPHHGYDCSGAVSAVLHAAGLLSAPMVAQNFMSWGKPGRGPVTLYASPGHVYMSMLGRFFGTSGANPGGGAGWFPGGPRPGFVVRHAPVTGSGSFEGLVPMPKVTGPGSPLKTIVTQAVRKADDGANHILQAAMAAMGHVGGGDTGDSGVQALPGGWFRVGATLDPTMGQPSAGSGAHGGMSFAELLVAGANAGLHSQDLAATMGMHNSRYGMPMGTELLVRKPGASTAHPAWKNDVGSGQRGNPHYKIDLHQAIADAIGWHPNQDVEVKAGGRSGGQSAAAISGRGNARGGVVPYLGAFGDGGAVYANEPSLMMIGDDGPETAIVIPHSKLHAARLARDPRWIGRHYDHVQRKRRHHLRHLIGDWLGNHLQHLVKASHDDHHGGDLHAAGTPSWAQDIVPAAPGGGGKSHVGFNPLTDQIETHSPSEWSSIHARAAKQRHDTARHHHRRHHHSHTYFRDIELGHTPLGEITDNHRGAIHLGHSHVPARLWSRVMAAVTKAMGDSTGGPDLQVVHAMQHVMRHHRHDKQLAELYGKMLTAADKAVATEFRNHQSVAENAVKAAGLKDKLKGFDDSTQRYWQDQFKALDREVTSLQGDRDHTKELYRAALKAHNRKLAEHLKKELSGIDDVLLQARADAADTLASLHAAVAGGFEASATHASSLVQLLGAQQHLAGTDISSLQTLKDKQGGFLTDAQKATADKSLADYVAAVQAQEDPLRKELGYENSLLPSLQGKERSDALQKIDDLTLQLAQLDGSIKDQTTATSDLKSSTDKNTSAVTQMTGTVSYSYRGQDGYVVGAPPTSDNSATIGTGI